MADEPNNLHEIFAAYRGMTAPAGAVETGEIDRSKLSSNLKNLDKRLSERYRIWLVLFVLILISAILVVWILVNNLKYAAGIISAAGLGVGGVYTKLREVEREISRIDIIIALVESVSEQQLGGIVRILSNKL